MIVTALVILIGFALPSPMVSLAIIAMIICGCHQAYRVFPFTIWAAKEIPTPRNLSNSKHVSLISANVQMENSSFHLLKTMLKKEDPDVVFLMEIDAVWEAVLSQSLTHFSTVISHPQSDHYGLIFATKLPCKRAEVVFLSDDTTPSIIAELECPTGNFFFVGLHPRPPLPGQDTNERDKQIQRAAQLADRRIWPVVTMGDFNDVSWSKTSKKFKDFGNFLDPRIGRGVIPSFDANSYLMRFPIDQVYLTEGFTLVSFERLRSIGSDHFPLKSIISMRSSID